MSILSRFRGWTGHLQKRAASVVPDILWRTGSFGASASSGVIVNERTACTASAIFAATRNISVDTATTPSYVYRSLGRRTKELLTDHYLTHLMRKPNPEMSRTGLLQCLVACAKLYGAGYALIERNQRTRLPVALWPVKPWTVKKCYVPNPDYPEAKLLKYKIDGIDELVDPKDLFILDIMPFQGVLDFMLMTYARDSIGLTLAAEQFASNWFQNAANLSGYLKVKGTLTQQAATEKVNQFIGMHSGIRNTGRIGIAQGDAEFVELKTANPEVSQLLQTRIFNLDEVCRWMRCPPFKIYSMGRATWGNSTQQSQDYIGDTLQSLYVQIEDEVKEKLLDPVRDRDVYMKFEPNERLLRVDPLTKAQIQMLQIRSSRTVNEIREENDDDALPPEIGDRMLATRDLIPLDKLIEEADAPKVDPVPAIIPQEEKPSPEDSPTDPDEETDTDEADKAETEKVIRGLAEINQKQLVENLGRAIHTEQDKATRATKRNELEPWKDSFYAGHGEVVQSMIESPIRAFIDSAIAVTGNVKLIESKAKLLAMSEDFAQRHIQDSLSDLADPDGLLQRVAGWDVRAEPFAQSAFEELTAQVKGLIGE